MQCRNSRSGLVSESSYASGLLGRRSRRRVPEGSGARHGPGACRDRRAAREEGVFSSSHARPYSSAGRARAVAASSCRSPIEGIRDVSGRPVYTLSERSRPAWLTIQRARRVSIMTPWLVLAAAYLIGAIPFGFL